MCQLKKHATNVWMYFLQTHVKENAAEVVLICKCTVIDWIIDILRCRVHKPRWLSVEWKISLTWTQTPRWFIYYACFELAVDFDVCHFGTIRMDQYGVTNWRSLSIFWFQVAFCMFSIMVTNWSTHGPLFPVIFSSNTATFPNDILGAFENLDFPLIFIISTIFPTKMHQCVETKKSNQLTTHVKNHANHVQDMPFRASAK